jgi:hypothetical protein
LLTLPGICRIDVRSRGDTFAIRPDSLTGGGIEPLPPGRLEDVALRAEQWDGPAVQMGSDRAAFRVRVGDRTIDLSVVVGLCRMLDHGLVRVSAQAILRDANA